MYLINYQCWQREALHLSERAVTSYGCSTHGVGGRVAVVYTPTTHGRLTGQEGVDAQR